MFLRFQQIYTAILQTSTNKKIIKCVKTCHPAAHLGKLRVSSPEVGHPPLEPKAFWSFAVPIHWSIMVNCQVCHQIIPVTTVVLFRKARRFLLVNPECEEKNDDLRSSVCNLMACLRGSDHWRKLPDNSYSPEVAWPRFSDVKNCLGSRDSYPMAIQP